MFSFILERQWTRQPLLWCLFISLFLPTTPRALFSAEEDTCLPCSPPPASCCSINFIDAEDRQQRSRLAAAAAGATLAGLTAGLIYVVACTSGRKGHHSRSSSCYSSYSSCYSSYSDSSYSGDSSRSNSSRCYSPSYSSDRSDSKCRKANLTARGPANAPTGFTKEASAIGRGGRCKVNPSPCSTLSGLFFPSFSFPERTKGSFTVFIQSPDGRVHSLGRISLVHPQHASLTFGPYTQPGLYTLGIRVEEEIEMPTHTQIGRFELYLNGSFIENNDFYFPSHASIGYEPPLATFQLK